ncbi:UBN2_3 domain-containing protein [Cephalotus follicularis]|uniref:UBN2_3 domain-containing protein n=1 Tax=Cephalotus follicularis TaxID=3775 RepID=A0A1Q3DDN5_CEPFO|nr:UBN2_3 domain-containing protein [Cephalotus follicularis]
MATTSTISTYPYPTTLNVGNFVTIKLTQNNFLLWETQILSLIESQDLLGFITCQIPAPAREIQGTNEQRVTNPDYISWRKTDRLVKAWITETLSEEVLGHAVRTETSQNLWTVLTKAFSQTSEAREFELHSKMQYHRKTDTMSIADYLNGFKLIFDQLHSIGKPISDQRKSFFSSPT